MLDFKRKGKLRKVPEERVKLASFLTTKETVEKQHNFHVN